MVEGSDRPVVVDEAYGEFAGESLISLVDKYPNLIVTRTFSKAYALAGMRVGYSVACKDMTLAMQKVRVPYSLDKVSEHVAIKALRDQDFVRRSVDIVRKERAHLEEGLRRLGMVPPALRCQLHTVQMPEELGPAHRPTGGQGRAHPGLRGQASPGGLRPHHHRDQGAERHPAGTNGGGDGGMALKVHMADYGVGNLHSIRKALENCGAKVEVVTDMRGPARARSASCCPAWAPSTRPWSDCSQ